MRRLESFVRAFRFGPFEADAHARELRKRGLRIQLGEKSYEILTSLLERPGELVTREELRRRLWPEGTFVDFDNSLNSAVNRLRDALGDRAARPRYIETLPRRGYRFVTPVERVPITRPTLAVLPFENLGHDPQHDFVADAVADALIAELGNISSLRVISRQSVLHLKGTQKTIPEIAHDLKADAIVEGSVLLAGDSVRMTVQLLEAAPEQHLWAKRYACELGGMLTLQGRVAREIAEAVEVTLTPDEIGRLSRQRPVNAEAHLAYLKACHHMGQASGEGFRKGFQYLDLALEKDPAHALAYARLAECYSLLGFWGHMPISEAYPRAKQAALKAIELDSALSTAHWALGWVSWVQDWDLAICEEEACRAIQLNPSEPLAHILHGIVLAIRGDSARAAAEARLALDVDPLSLYINTSAAWVCLFAKDYQRAREQARAALDLFPNALQACYVLGWAEVALARIDRAIEALEKAVAISPDPISIGYLGHVQARAGHREIALSLLDDLLSRLKLGYVPAKSFVAVYAGLGELDRAFEWLEKAYQERDPMLFWLLSVPAYEPLRSDPRCDQMLRRIGLCHS